MHNHKTHHITEAKEEANIQIMLSRSYSLFFIFFVFGLIIDVLTRFRINTPGIENVGLILIIISSLLVYWAQSVNKRPKFLADGTRNFAYGPYAFSRHPTYLGIFILTLGAAFLMSSVSILVTSILAYAVSSFTVMEKEEKRHIKKYGEQYLRYKKQVRRVL